MAEARVEPLNKTRQIEIEQKDGNTIISYKRDFVNFLRFFSLLDSKHDFEGDRSMISKDVHTYLYKPRGIDQGDIIEKKIGDKTKSTSISSTASTLHHIFTQENKLGTLDDTFKIIYNGETISTFKFYDYLYYNLDNKTRDDIPKFLRSAIISFDALKEKWYSSDTDSGLNIISQYIKSLSLTPNSIYDASNMNLPNFYQKIYKEKREDRSRIYSFISDIIDPANTKNIYVKTNNTCIYYRIPLITESNNNTLSIIYRRSPNDDKEKRGFEFYFEYTQDGHSSDNKNDYIHAILLRDKNKEDKYDLIPGVKDITTYFAEKKANDHKKKGISLTFLERAKKVARALKNIFSRLIRINKQKYDIFFETYMASLIKFLEDINFHLKGEELQNYMISSLIAFKTTGDQTRIFDNFLFEQTNLIESGGNIEVPFKERYGHTYTLTLDSFLRDLNYLGNLVPLIHDTKTGPKALEKRRKLNIFYPQYDDTAIDRDILEKIKEREDKLKQEESDKKKEIIDKIEREGLYNKLYDKHDGLVKIDHLEIENYYINNVIVKEARSLGIRRSIRVLNRGTKKVYIISKGEPKPKDYDERYYYYFLLLDIHFLLSRMIQRNQVSIINEMINPENIEKYPLKEYVEIYDSMNIYIENHEKYSRLREKIIDNELRLKKKDIVEYDKHIEEDRILLNKTLNIMESCSQMLLYKYIIQKINKLRGMLPSLGSHNLVILLDDVERFIAKPTNFRNTGIVVKLLKSKPDLSDINILNNPAKREEVNTELKTRYFLRSMALRKKHEELNRSIDDDDMKSLIGQISSRQQQGGNGTRRKRTRATATTRRDGPLQAIDKRHRTKHTDVPHKYTHVPDKYRSLYDRVKKWVKVFLERYPQHGEFVKKISDKYASIPQPFRFLDTSLEILKYVGYNISTDGQVPQEIIDLYNDVKQEKEYNLIIKESKESIQEIQRLGKDITPKSIQNIINLSEFFSLNAYYLYEILNLHYYEYDNKGILHRKYVDFDFEEQIKSPIYNDLIHYLNGLEDNFGNILESVSTETFKYNSIKCRTSNVNVDEFLNNAQHDADKHSEEVDNQLEYIDTLENKLCDYRISQEHPEDYEEQCKDSSIEDIEIDDPFYLTLQKFSKGFPRIGIPTARYRSGGKNQQNKTKRKRRKHLKTKRNNKNIRNKTKQRKKSAPKHTRRRKNKK